MPRLLPQSPRKRRRLLRLAIVAAALAVVGILLAFFRNTGTSTETPLSNTPATVVRPPKEVPATGAERRAAERSLDVFVHSAILRSHLAASWPLASPKMLVDTTRAQWLRGELPVPPYPRADFKTASWRLVGSYPRLLDYDVLVLPKRAKGEQRVYSCELREYGRRWLVDYCYPRTSFG